MPGRRPTWHDAYDAQMALWRFYRTPRGRRFMQEHFAFTAQSLRGNTRVLLQALYTAEMGRLIDLDPLFVSAEMSDVVAAAAPHFKPEPLLETDLLTPRGFLYFEQPIVVPDRDGDPTAINAVSWSRLWARPSDEAKAAEYDDAIQRSERIGSSYLGVAEDELDKMGARTPGVGLVLYQQTPDGFEPGGPPLYPIHTTPWYFGMTFDGNEMDENGRTSGAEWWWRVVQTTFRLMQQRIAAKHLMTPDRLLRKSARRAGFPDDRNTVVVRLRRELGEEQEPSGETANYSHRFIVSGHWRNQFYAREGIHRQIWIGAFVKGSPELPLIVRPRRVFTWSR